MSFINIASSPSSGSGNVSAASNFGSDNRLLRSDGTAKGVQGSGIAIDDNDQVSWSVAGGSQNALIITAQGNNARAVYGIGQGVGSIGVLAQDSTGASTAFAILNGSGVYARVTFVGTTDRLFLWPDKSGTVALTTDIKFYEEMRLQFPHQVDGTGAVIDPVPTSPTYGHAIFSPTAAKAANFALYRFQVPMDLVTTADPIANLAIRLGGTDIKKHAYKLSMADVTAGANSDTPVFINEIALNHNGDAAGAGGDVEFIPAIGSYVTLSNWAASLTPGHLIVVKLARDGTDATQDDSTVSSSDIELMILYPRQPSLLP